MNAGAVIVAAICWSQLTPCLMISSKHQVLLLHMCWLHRWYNMHASRVHSCTAFVKCTMPLVRNIAAIMSMIYNTSCRMQQVCGPCLSPGCPRRVLWFNDHETTLAHTLGNSAVVPLGYSHCCTCQSCKCNIALGACYVDHAWSVRCMFYIRKSKHFHIISNHEWRVRMAQHVPANPAVYEVQVQICSGKLQLFVAT